MGISELGLACKEFGMSFGIFLLCSWMVITIVKRMCSSLDKLITKFEVFMNRVKAEHDRAEECHKGLMEQHKGIIETLGRVNGYK